ncbi:CheY-like chemotaxis protein [Flavobacterium sp. W4I14]|nr:CheY-like chemotaxis protein [Flavobacterium sp. W4I14]
MKTRILIIDDDELIILLHKELIGSSEFSMGARYFLKAERALSYIKKNISTDIAFLLLLDINMPGMDGWDLLDELQKLLLKNNIYVVMVTSSVLEADRDRAKGYEMVHGFLSKPLRIDHFKILKKLKKIIETY